MTVAFISHPSCALHDMGPGHPERPQRLSAIGDRVLASGLEAVLRHYDAPQATRAQLMRAHDAAYVDEVLAVRPRSELVWLDPDTAMNPHSAEAALHAAGAAVLGVDLAMSGEAGCAFCSVRPPGHHAERGRAMGFCLFNNVAVGAAHALEAHRLERVAILDFDVHHGNGTEDIFAGERRVLFCSTFQHPYYPYSGTGPCADNVVNVPLPAGSDGKAFRDAVSEHWLPRVEAFAPQLVMVSAGFDAHRDDELAQLRLVEDDYAWVTAEIKRLADNHAGGRIVSCLEGGYALGALGRSVVAHLNAMLG
jgi:acetoin utilization deacetylase AcuC-like enzyme